MTRDVEVGERVLPAAVARAVRSALVDVVENGTGRRARGAFHGPDGGPLVAGGKTGTGDHRYERFGRGGEVIESRVVNRTATFVFFLGDRFFGVRSEEHTSELQSLMRISYAVFCLKKKNKNTTNSTITNIWEMKYMIGN